MFKNWYRNPKPEIHLSFIGGPSLMETLMEFYKVGQFGGTQEEC